MPRRRAMVVAITRPLRQADELANIAVGLGWTPLIAPTVEVSPADRSPALDAFLSTDKREPRDLCVFTSQNGVTLAFDEARRSGTERALRERLSRCAVAAIGPKTADAAERMGVRVDIVPKKHSSDGILEELARRGIEGGRAWILRSDIGGSALLSGLKETHDEVVDIPIYNSRTPSDTAAAEHLIREILAGRVDAITFTSASAAENLFDIARAMSFHRDLLRQLNNRVLVAVIGDVTMRALDRLGVEVDVVPSVFTLDRMMRALDDHVRSRGAAKREGLVGAGSVLDPTDRALIDELQYGFTVCSHPFSEIASRLGLGEDEVIGRVGKMLDTGIVRRIGPVVDRRHLGLIESTLVAARVPKDRVPDAVSKINRSPQVSHNYERDHEYNIWFTVAGRDRGEVEAAVREIMADIGVAEDDMLELPSVVPYKIDARLRME